MTRWMNIFQLLRESFKRLESLIPLLKDKQDQEHIRASSPYVTLCALKNELQGRNEGESEKPEWTLLIVGRVQFPTMTFFFL